MDLSPSEVIYALKSHSAFRFHSGGIHLSGDFGLQHNLRPYMGNSEDFQWVEKIIDKAS